MLSNKPLENCLFNHFMILFILMILTSISKQECLEIDDFEIPTRKRLRKIIALYYLKYPEDQAKINESFLFGYTPNIYFKDPNDSTMMVRIEKAWPGELRNLGPELKRSFEMAKKDQETSNNTGMRFAPRVTESYCVERYDAKNQSAYALLIFVSDRFRNSLYNLGNEENPDQRLLDSLTNLSSRFMFYAKMIKAYKTIPDMKLKHCYLRPQAFLYIEKNPDFSQDYDNGSDLLTFDPVLTDFAFVTNWESVCSHSDYAWLDKKDLDSLYKMGDSNRPQLELSSLALIIMYVESSVLFLNYNKRNITFENIKTAFANVPKTESVELKNNLGEVPFLKENILDGFKGLLKITEMWKAGINTTYTYDQQRLDFQEFFVATRIFVDLILKEKGESDENIPELLSFYDQFNNLLLEMSKENSYYYDLRPTLDATIELLTNLSLAAAQKEGSRRRNRRNVMLV